MNKDLAKSAELALTKVFKEKGLPLSKLPWLMAQVAHETGGFKSRVSATNNLSGIKYVPGNNFGATKGILSPEGDHYAAYNGGVYYWAKQYVYEITKKSNPLQADTVEGFVDRLKQNGYFGNYKHGTEKGNAEQAAYLKAVNSWKNQITQFLKMNWPTVATGGTLLVVIVAIIIFVDFSK